jgi:CRP-like cAMP-binding protein
MSTQLTDNQQADDDRQPDSNQHTPDRQDEPVHGHFCLLSSADVFQDLAQEDLEEIERTLTKREVGKGRIIYMPDDNGEMLFILKEGRVQLYRLSADGRKLVLSILDPGSIFGEMSIIGQGMRETFAEAALDSIVCVMQRQDLEKLILNRPQVALRLISIIGQRLTETESRLRDIAFKSVSARVALLLLRLAEKGGPKIEGFTHQEIAEIVGTYRETTTQALNDFRNRGLIAIGRKRIDILDAEKLRRAAEKE